MKKKFHKPLVLLIMLFAFIVNTTKAISQTITFDYTSPSTSNPDDGCPCHFGPNWDSNLNYVTETNGTQTITRPDIEAMATHGCIGNGIAGLGLSSAFHNGGGGTTFTRGNGYVIKMNFIAGMQYKITITGDFYSIPLESYQLPSLQVRMSNTFTTGTRCTVSAEAIDISSTTDPYGEFTSSGQSIIFTPATCYQYLLLSTKPNSAIGSESALNLQKLVIETLNTNAISGNLYNCGVENYTLTNYPPGSSVTWSVQPAGFATLTPNGNTVTITKVMNGQGTLTATMTNPCGTVLPSISRPIYSGAPQIYSGFYSYPGYGPYGLQEDEELSYSNSVCVARSAVSMNTSMDIRGANAVVWSKVYSTLGLAWAGSDNNGLGITFKAAGQKGVFAVTATNTCGSVTKSYGFQAVSCSALQANYSLYPNPASSVLNIETTSNITNDPTSSFSTDENTLSTASGKKANLNSEDELQVQFFNIKTSKLELTKKLSVGSKKIDVSGLSRGTFLVVIKNKNNEIVKKEQVVLK